MIEIGLLGSMRVRRNAEDVTPSAPKLRQVLALLVLNANSLVSVDQLCEELWEDRPPLSALTTLQTYIYQLRRRLLLATGQHGAPFGTRPPHGCPALLTRVGGYELRLDNKQSVDAYRFDQLTEQGMAQLRRGDGDEAARTLKNALSLWQGRALVDISTGRRLSAWSTQLEERRKSVQEQRFSLELELGRHHAVLDELSEAFRAHPTHEAFAGQLMRALHRCGRRPDALNTFRTLRSHLVEELGLEPSAQLQRLHQEVLADRGHLRGPAATAKADTAPGGRRLAPGPAQLPADVGDFVGRERELDQLETFLGADRASTGMRVVEVHGPPGVGKSAFAVRAAHRLRPRFPDGQLFIDLSTVGEGSQQLADVLSACLTACGIQREKQPAGLDELSRLFRSWTADRRVLVVVDDVLTASQVRAVLPGGSGCAVIATNRYRAHSLSTGRKIVLPALSPEESLQLYDRVAGERSRQEDPAAVQELMGQCEGLPLAIRAVAGRLTARPGWSAARLALRLRGNHRVLLELPAGTQSLMATMAASHRHLLAPSQELLRLLLQRERPRWSLDEVVARLRPGIGDAETLLEYLVDVHLVQEHLTADAEPLYSVPRLTRQALILLLRGAPASDVPNGRTGAGGRTGAHVTLMKTAGVRR
ncbi:SARP family transcriptional regulator [Streptomyces poonensis]|uniref:SARP family transcriptional regulator n=2 Tax=Streptomyces poonensis TaxID=68255 RepID=A0A918PJC2_9ACTN|nr:SARP family transcriptional regulator [Streptomyces poonensis]GLJ91650.1 SARP family transcriptional regulator [Streptomyces poonensis]